METWQAMNGIYEGESNGTPTPTGIKLNGRKPPRQQDCIG